MGVGLLGLAYYSPEVANDFETTKAVAMVTILGSTWPDMDIIYRFFSDAAYIRNHRGWSHALPILLLWAMLLTGFTKLFFPSVSFGLLVLWGSIAGAVHVVTDLFNPYGTKAFWPFYNKWVAFNSINIFDPVLFCLHLVGFFCWWVLAWNPALIFTVVYLILIGYFLLRLYDMHTKRNLLIKLYRVENDKLFLRYTVTPSMRLGTWGALIEENGTVVRGVLKRSGLTQLEKVPVVAASLVGCSQVSKAVAALKSFSTYVYPVLLKIEQGSAVCWFDMRYYYPTAKKHPSLVAVAIFDKQEQLIASFVGWYRCKDLFDKALQFLK
jgi:inner membrane protein